MNLPCLLNIENDFKNEVKMRFPLLVEQHGHIEPELIVFSQTWGSTSLGFGGIGGQAMTSVYTTVIWNEFMNVWAVFFGNRMAYIIKDPNDLFKEIN